MSLTAEESAALATDTLTPDATDAVHDAPASGAQPTTETLEAEPIIEGVLEDKSEAETEKKEEGEGAKPKTEEPRTWKAVEAAKKAQLQVARARTEVAQREQRIVQHEQHLQSRAQQLAQREASVAKLERALQSHDLDSLLELGFDYEKATRRRLEDADPQARLNKLERDIKERDAENERQRVTQAQVQETRTVAERLVTFVEDGAEQYPELYAWTPDRVANEGLEIRDAYARKFRSMPTYAQVLGELQRRAKAEADAATQRRTTLEQRQRAKASGAGSAGKAGTEGKSGSPNTPALLSATAAIRATPPRQKTEAEIDEECLAELRTAFRK